MAFTRTPELCWYCAWTGYVIDDREGDAAKVRHPSRDYFVSSGPIEEVASFGYGEGPDIWWPADRGWCVGSDTDLAASYIGGSAACIEALLSSEILEALSISSDDRVDINADVINSSQA